MDIHCEIKLFHNKPTKCTCMESGPDKMYQVGAPNTVENQGLSGTGKTGIINLGIRQITTSYEKKKNFIFNPALIFHSF